MKKVLTVIGARPQFVKAGAVSKVLRQELDEILVHTGQHYDENMSQIFFDELDIPRPDYNLGIGSGLHGEQTGRMMIELEKVVLEQNPDMLLTYGDTNSTLACALVGAKLHIPIAHVEAGLRSFDRNMPEEINRVVTDHVSDLLFCPTERAVSWLLDEGISKNVYNVGDVMYDSVLNNLQKACKDSQITKQLGLSDSAYYLATIHRPANTDSKVNLSNIFKAFDELDLPVIVPLHPRTKKYLEKYAITPSANVKVIDPVGYLDMLRLLSGARKLITDSGGMQKEAFFTQTPCVTVRHSTEWVETIELQANVLVKPIADEIVSMVHDKLQPDFSKSPYGDGKAAEKIVNEILNS